MNTLTFQPVLAPWTLLIMGLIMLSAFLFFYYIYKREKEFEQKEGAVFKDYNQIIQEAHAKAKDIIDQASVEASAILTQSHNAKQDLETKEGDAFKKITDEQIQLLHTNSDSFVHDYQLSLDEVKSHYATRLSDALQAMQESTEKEISALKETLTAQVADSQTGITQQLQNDIANTKIEINEYKRHQFEKIQKSIDEILIKLAEEVLGKVIPVRDHEQLITDALEKAQKEGMFNT